MPETLAHLRRLGVQWPAESDEERLAMAHTGTPGGPSPRPHRRPRWNEDAIALLASGAKVTAVNRSTGVPRRTLTRWLADPEFQRRLQQYRAELYDAPVGILGAYAAQAAATLGALAVGALSESVKLAAARAVLEVGRSLREATEFEQRLAALEGRLNGGQS
jgi:hypothetical protein